MAENGSASPSGKKRSHNEVEAEGAVPDGPREVASESSDDGFGPALPSSSAPPKKKRKRRLQHEDLFIAALPTGTRYSKSLMHKSTLAFTVFTPRSEFLITSSTDGQVNFWKKARAEGDIDFVKEFKAHQGEVTSVAVSWDGNNFASAGADGTVKVWDVVSFDLIAVIEVSKAPAALCWVNDRSAGQSLLAIGNEQDGIIDLYDVKRSTKSPQKTLLHMHKRSVIAMAYNFEYNCVVSADQGGMLEYWRPGGDWVKPDNVFEMKTDTDLFAFKKSKSVPTTITLSPSGKRFATFSFPDRKVRVFEFGSGKLHRTYDESIATITEMQQAGTAVAQLESVEFGRRLTIEQDLEKSPLTRCVNVIFDETGHFIMYGSILGTKVINTFTNKVVKVYGQEESIRPLNLSLYQGQPDKKGVVTVAMAASENPLLQEAEERDAVLVSTAFNKVRFYMFTNDTDPSKSTRDVQNEKPTTLNASNAASSTANAPARGTSATLHTTYGDIHVRLFPDAAPKAVENFVTHARNGYYNNVLFHRVIRKFMIQTGDPLGDGTGGESIWGGEFEDEFVDALKHDRAYTLSMANAGPNTNGSQFFITTEKTPWLDGKHTIFGRAVQGLDVVHKIENARVRKEKPDIDIKIVNISVD